MFNATLAFGRRFCARASDGLCLSPVERREKTRQDHAKHDGRGNQPAAGYWSPCLRFRRRRSDFGKEAIAAPWNRLNETRTLCGFAQGFAESANGVVQPILKFHEAMAGPQALLQLFSCYHVTRMLGWHCGDEPS